MLESYALYSTELSDEERELGFEMVELSTPRQRTSVFSDAIRAVAYRLSQTDQIVKMNVPYVGGFSYRHERLAQSAGSNIDPQWEPIDSVVFPTAQQALRSVGNLVERFQFCH